MAFWCAKSELKDARIVLLGVPLEQTTTGIPGTRLGPDRIRAYSENVEAYSPYFKKDLKDIPIHDAGNLEFDYMPSIEAKLELISEKMTGYLSSDSKPLLIKPLLVGGEHTLTLGAVQAMTHKYPDLCVLQLDAHADLRDIGESGSRIAHDTVMRRVMELLKPDSLFQFGIRSFCKEEIQQIKLVKSYPKAIQKLAKSWSKVSQKIVKNRPVWLTFDLDVLDPSIMPAVGTPEPGGASYREIIDFLLGLKGLNFVGADIVEFNPLAADFAAPAVVAANLVRELALLISIEQ